MTNKTTMPEPVAWVRRHPDGALTAEFLEDAVISPVRKQSGAWLPMITTDQAEAYANQRAKQALEEAIIEVMRCKTSGAIRNGTVDKCADAIRALIPKEQKT